MIRVDNSDLHTHSSYSDGRGSLEDNVRAAEAAGLDAVAIADHLFPEGHPRFGDRERLRQRLEEVRQVRSWAGLPVIMAVEATATDVEGTLSASPQDLEGVELSLVDVGSITAGVATSVLPGRERQLASVLRLYGRLAGNELVDGLAHPFALGCFGLDITLEDLPETALRELGANLAEHGTAFEINNGFWWWWPQFHPMQVAELYARVVAAVAEGGARFTLGSDAHCNTGVGNLGWAKRVAQLAGLSNHSWAVVQDLVGERR